MAVDETSLERIRKATFPASRRGYDKREVDKFLNRLADWLETGGGDQARSDTVRRELERVGERTGAILAEAEDSAQQIKAEAEQEVAQLRADVAAETEQARNEADAYSAEARAAADSYSKETRAAADQYSQETQTTADQASADSIAAGESKAERTIAEGVQRRKDIEAVIGDLASRRDQAIGDLEALGSKLQSAITDHTPAGGDPFEIPEELDPAAREGGPDGGGVADLADEIPVSETEDDDLSELDLEDLDGELAESELDDELEADLEAEAEAEVEADTAIEDGVTDEHPAPKKRSSRRRTSKSKS